MAFSDRIIGFSTGALARGDFKRALHLIRAKHIEVVELSALREEELPILSAAISTLDLSEFRYVSFHSPSRFERLSEEDALRYLTPAMELQIPIVVHPDTIRSERWRELGNLLVIENLDKRKPCGRTLAELEEIFSSFPEAGFCLDIAHARQVDPTMVEATQMLRVLKGRLRQIHASGLNSASRHSPLSAASSFAISRVSHLIPADLPVVLESTVSPDEMESELDFARTAFSPWFGRLQTDIDDVFAFRAMKLREGQVDSFLSSLAASRIKLSSFEDVIKRLPSGGAYKPGDAFLSARDLLARLSDAERIKLKEYFNERLRTVRDEYPELVAKYAEQFS